MLNKSSEDNIEAKRIKTIRTLIWLSAPCASKRAAMTLTEKFLSL